MHLANWYYGHNHLLGRWVGLDRPLPIWGYLQHGFNEGTGFSPDEPPRRVPAFVWNDRNGRAAVEAGLRVSVLGAPFIYLVSMSDSTRTSGGEGGTLVYPFHGWELGRTTGGHDRYATEVAEREGVEGTTVCLYWLEFEDPRIRTHYERAGFRVICHGRREDSRFLERQLVELRRHTRVVSNELGSAIWYAGYLGRELEIYGPMMAVEGRDPVAVRRAREERWPEVFGGPVSPTTSRRVAELELGHEHLRSPQEVAAMFGWTGALRLLGRPLAPLSHELQRIKRRREGW